MQVLPDYLDHHLKLLCIGSNPSPASIAEQCYYGNPRNRFWKALNGSGLVDEPLAQAKESFPVLLQRYRIGFTDVVKPPTPGVAQLRASDYKQWAPVLAEKILHFSPEVCWFQGKVPYSKFLKYAGVTNDKVEKINWGVQSLVIGCSRVFVTPNPSPANAVFSLDDLIMWYKKLQQYSQEN